MFNWFKSGIPGAIVLEKGAIMKEIARHDQRLGHLAKRISQITDEKTTVVEHLDKQIADHTAEQLEVQNRKKALETLAGAL